MLFSEPKIPQTSVSAGTGVDPSQFQCSSASRKFLKSICSNTSARRRCCFSALQRAENSSNYDAVRIPVAYHVSVLFSEPKIPQIYDAVRIPVAYHVSVLFSEPKIPQTGLRARAPRRSGSFSALQRAENSSNLVAVEPHLPAIAFQCSSASRKFLKSDPRTCVHPYFRPR